MLVGPGPPSPSVNSNALLGRGLVRRMSVRRSYDFARHPPLFGLSVGMGAPFRETLLFSSLLALPGLTSVQRPTV